MVNAYENIYFVSTHINNMAYRKYSPSHRQNLQKYPTCQQLSAPVFFTRNNMLLLVEYRLGWEKNTYLTNHDDLGLKKDLKGVLYVCRQATEYITFQHTE